MQISVMSNIISKTIKDHSSDFITMSENIKHIEWKSTGERYLGRNGKSKFSETEKNDKYHIVKAKD